jgi:hypothetical protein
VEANTFRQMVLELDRRFPGLGRQIEESIAVAIDGEIFEDACLTTLNPDLTIGRGLRGADHLHLKCADTGGIFCVLDYAAAAHRRHRRRQGRPRLGRSGGSAPELSALEWNI